MERTTAAGHAVPAAVARRAVAHGRRAGVLAIALAALLAPALSTAVAACGGSTGGAGSAASVAPTPSQIESAQPGDVISWSEAATSVGQTLMVEGPVASTARGRGPGGPAILLSIGLPAPSTSRFVAIVPLAVYRRLPADTRDQLDVALVRVAGKIINYRGATAIVVARPADLRLAQ